MSEEVATGAAVEEAGSPSAETDKTPGSESTSETAEAKPAESPSKDEADGESEDEPKEWVNLVKKYDGDKAKIGESYWRANNEAARLARENKDLKAAIEKAKASVSIPAPKTEPAEKPLTEHPSIQKLESEITALDQGLEVMRTEGLKLKEELNAQAKKVAGLEYSIGEAGELASDDQKQRLAVAQDRLAILAERFEAKREKYSEKEQRLKDAQARRETVRAEAEAERARQQRAEQDKAKFNADFPQYIDDLIARRADEAGVSEDAPKREHLWKVVNNALMVQLWRLGNADISEVDHEELVKAEIDEYVKVFGLTKKAAFAEVSREKAKVASHKITPGAPLTPAQKAARKPELLQIGGVEDPKLRAARIRLAAKGM